MNQIDARYASPGLRWGLLLEDHPAATHRFGQKKGSEIGVPAAYGGDGLFCVATIEIPGQEPVIGYKPCKAKGDADEWNVLCTKALGRALKRAGYPDHMPDLKALVLWRQRNAEIVAVSSGVAALPAVQDDERVLDAAAVAEPDVDPDEPEEEPVSDGLRDEVVKGLAGLDEQQAAEWRAHRDEHGLPAAVGHMDNQQLLAAHSWLTREF